MKRKTKGRVLTQSTPSVAQTIVDAIIIKDEDLFSVTQADGSMPLKGKEGFGLYYHDCRYLKGYELKIAGTDPIPLVSDMTRGRVAVLELTNADLKSRNRTRIPRQHIGIRWERTISGRRIALHDNITFQNLGHSPIEFPIALKFQAGFEDIFFVRGLMPRKVGKHHRPVWENGVLSFIYEGYDGLYRGTAIHFSTTIQATEGTTAHLGIKLEPRKSKNVRIVIVLHESSDLKDVSQKLTDPSNLANLEDFLSQPGKRWFDIQTQIETDNQLLSKVMDRSLYDLRILRSHLKGEEFIAAGLPWFGTLFGRDSIITALQTLAYEPWIAEQTLRLLASYQGQNVDEWRDEQPGKILHEVRVGELARSGEIPHNPYYGTIDATPLFLILVARHASWVGNLTLFNDLKSNIERALEWMAEYGDLDKDGYVEYRSTSEKGLVNQGWKDSGESIINEDGSFGKPPIALVEVQGYVYLAKITMADLYRRAGEPDRADRLEREAEELRGRFNRDFWLEEKGFYALALQAENKPAAVLSSNPGHALWAGIADPDKAQKTVLRLMADDMFSGWGVRTLSIKEHCYNPIGYHLGTVWPHDNSIIAAGFRRYGYDEAALRIFKGLFNATVHFEASRLPELFSGFSKEDFHVPVRYPVACHPQAWAAGSIPYLMETLLGLAPEAFQHRLRIIRPILPEYIHYVQVSNLRVGNARTDLRFESRDDGNVSVKVLKVEGQLDVVIELQ